jgi:hypothetical protein
VECLVCDKSDVEHDEENDSAPNDFALNIHLHKQVG